MENFCTKESKYLTLQPTSDERAAGVSEMFEKYGAFNLLYSLAKGDPLKLDEAFNLNLSVAFTTLMRWQDEERARRAMQHYYNSNK